MDKIKLKGSRVMLCAVIIFTGLLLSGCETAKGFATGVGATAQGVGKDSYNLWTLLKKTDTWMTENLW
ncbi:MAG: hypothetical protein WC532_03565 [Candidatus Omnitrophota bacterium]